MTIVVGIFDNARDLDQAIVKLATQGFEDTVYDDAIVAQERGFGRPTGEDSQSAHLEAFKRHLEGYHVPDQVIEGYANTFYHGGKFVVVKTNKKRAPEAVAIMGQCQASQVNRHG